MTNVSRIQAVSSMMAWLCVLPLVFLPVGTVWFWANFNQYFPSLAGSHIVRVVDPHTVTSLQLWAAGIFNLCVLFVLLYGVWHLRSLFLEFKKGAFFTNNSVRHLHLFALMLLLSAVLKVLQTAVLSIILTWNNPPGKKALVVGVGSPEISMLLIAGTIFVVSWILKEGQRLAIENAEFV